MNESYGCCTIADGWFIFGTRRIRYLMGLVHWAHDFTRINGTRNLDAFDGDAIAFRKDLDLALHRAECRKKESNQADTVSKAANPGKFKDKRKPRGNQHLGTIFLQPGVSMVYLSRTLCTRWKKAM